MVDFKKLADQAKKVVDRQGGPDALKEKARELREVAGGKGSVSDKAKAAAEIVKEKPEAEPTATEPGDGATGGGAAEA